MSSLPKIPDIVANAKKPFVTTPYKKKWVLSIEKETLKSKVLNDEGGKKQVDLDTHHNFVLNTGAANKWFLVLFIIFWCY